MTLEANRRLVQAFLQTFKHNDFGAALAMMTDDATWWVAGKPENFALAGTKSKEELEGILAGVIQLMPGGMEMCVKAMTAEGDRVAAEVESFADTATGKIYNNEYHMLFIIEDGKISAVKEYCDTKHSQDVFSG